MLRRTFVQGLAAAAVPSLWSRGLFAAAGDARHGDLEMRPLASNHWQLIFRPERPRSLRLLQLADTHFHRDPENSTAATEKVLRAIVAQEQPDFLVHTGDFVNNDGQKPVEWSGLDVINGLGVPWTLCIGNHDYPVHQAEGSRSLEEIRQGMERGYQGYTDLPTGRHYCYRYDLQSAENAPPAASLFFFQVGHNKEKGERRISDPQLVWFAEQMQRDEERGVRGPITVFVHIPLREYNVLFDSGKVEGVKGERVCYDSDTGVPFQRFAASGRVVGVFCGHDHVNSYHGLWQGIDLAYGRVSGWGGYGPDDWQRGGRLITLDLANPRPTPVHREVFGTPSAG
ncbi:MAG: metallophosphoesterase [Pirellulales bacterium]